MTTRQKAVAALRERLAAVLGPRGEPLDRDGRTSRLEENVIASVGTRQLVNLRRQLERGDGGELRTDSQGRRPKFNSAHSSSALALNAFGAWLGREDSLTLCGLSARGATLRLEAHQRIFRGGRAPNLDCLLSAERQVIGVESKLTEPLSIHHGGTWSDAYARQDCQDLLSGGWSSLLDEHLAGIASDDYLDVGQLVKHALGLRAQNRDRDVHLVYVYWEPENADDFDEFRRHRAEVARLAARVDGEPPHLHPISYPDLFDAWETADAPPWVSAHIGYLRARYSVTLS